MVLSLKHTFTSPKADGTDSTLIQPSNWNAEHTITLAAGKVLGRDSSGNGAAQELPLAFDPTGQAMVPPVGTTAQRPATPVTGMLRFNTTVGKFEQYNGTTWGSIGGGASISDTAPSVPQPGDLWWKSDEGQMYVYYADANSSQWVVANAYQGGTAFGGITVTSINNGPLAGSRNRIINGAMEIDQRNAGAAVANANGYTVDRWGVFFAGTGRQTAQRSTVAPSGFVNSLLTTVSTVSATPAASDFNITTHIVEGLNIADLAWGTAAAKTVTVSFWVRCSVAGTYAFSMHNGSVNRSYVTTYTINAANTWEYKTITVAGDTTGTWVTDNTQGVHLTWDQGSGSNYNVGTPNAWSAGNFLRTSGAVTLVANNGATFYLTGVQLEVGSQATPFERRNYQQELAMCQRYYEQDDIAATGSPKIATSGLVQGTTQYVYGFKVQKRATPTVAMTFLSSIDNATSAVGTTSIASGSFRGYNTISNGSFYYADAWVRYAASAEL